ncbi:MAG: ATP-binding protein [Deltaproteobacteria bacterium]|nr:ATP-binding protein [Deltaproteobacteria bacterium]
MIHRSLKPLRLQESFFLFGARGTGKTTLLRECFGKKKNCLWLDLLDLDLQDRFSRRPTELLDQIAADPKLEWVVIDEIQKVPKLLDIVHDQIERTGIKFALCGSSARKLKLKGVNLLAGRAFVYNLFPFTHEELGDFFDLDSALQFGTLPKLMHLESGDQKRSFLRAYALTYLNEEIWAEHLIRKLDPFRRFIEVCAQCNGEILNFTKISRDVGADVKTVQSYFKILEDTLVGILLDSYHQSIRKRQIMAPKFYLFDSGVKRAMERTLTVELLPNTYAYGKAFEHFVILEIIRQAHYLQNDFRFSYLKTKDGAEIDLIVERPGRPIALVEIKSTDKTNQKDTNTLERFLKSFPNAQAYCLSRDSITKKIGSVRTIFWSDGLREICQGK